MIHAKQWHYSLQQRLPVASFIHSTRRNPRDSSSINSTCRRQGDLLSSLQRPTRHSRHCSRKTFHRHSSSTRTFQSFQTFQSFMTFQPSRHYYMFQHFFNQNANSTHRLVPTRNSIEYQSKTIHNYKTFILQRKGDVAIWVRMTLSVK